MMPYHFLISRNKRSWCWLQLGGVKYCSSCDQSLFIFAQPTLQICTVFNCVPFSHCTVVIQYNVEVTVKYTVNQLYNYSTVLGTAIKCKPYSEITVEFGTHLKTVKITLNIFQCFWKSAVSSNFKMGDMGHRYCH